jgi:hypothetical protein
MIDTANYNRTESPKASRKIKSRSMALILGLLFGSVFLSSCEFFDYTPLEVVSFTPSDPRVLPSSVDRFRFTFSEAVSRVQGEKNFSLRGRSGEVYGTFQWPSSSVMEFIPLEPLEDNDSYSLRIESALEDLEGDNLSKEFFFQFGQITDLTPPNALNYNLENITPEVLRPDLIFTFTEEVTFSSFLEAFSISPSPLKSFSSPDNVVYTVSFLEDLDPQADYRVRVSQGITDLFGNSSTVDHEWTLEVGSDETAPAILSLDETSGSGLGLEVFDPSDPDIERTSQIPTDALLAISFDEEMDRESVESAISLIPSRPFESSWSPDNQTLTLSFEDELTFGQEYYLRLSSTAEDLWGNSLEEVLYIFTADAPASQPPLLQSISFGALGSVIPIDGDEITLADSTYPEEPGAVNAELHLSFDLATAASLEALNAMDNVLVEYSRLGTESNPIQAMEVSTLSIDPGNPGTIILGLIISQGTDSFLGTLSIQVFEGVGG